MGRAAYILRRLVQMVPTLIILAILVFLMIRAIPGDPAVTVLGIQATPAKVAQMRRQMGLDKPLPVQFGIYVGQIVRGDLGTSSLMQVSVGSLVKQRLPITLGLVAYAMILALLITVPLAVVAATHENGWIDQFVRGFTILGISVPAFWVGLLLLIWLGAKVKIFPIGGVGPSPLSDIRYLFLPALTLAFGISAILIRNLRDALLTTMDQDFVTVARAKGLRSRVVLMRHVLRNALLSTVTLIGLYLGWLVGGSVIIEDVFAIPGMGSMLISSILARDYAVVQGFTLVYAVLVLVIYLLTDLTYAVIDPRVSY